MSGTELITIVPTRYKPLVALVGTVLAVLVPLVVSVQDYLPQPWPAVIGVVIVVLTTLGVYHAPYVPPGAVLAPAPTPPATPNDDGSWKNPWQ